ncbi:ETX/MTX2 family pore-forming toxin [Streptomyces sp. NBC_01264]|uniref:ETX/MTX2 family pore-forming toxin n=1 Tax=Streptomyces sp. NBC_01264 TaxID=2903804 RepID=UPI00225BB5AE|nr:ETX/MTX2 family pore-forming toxin [Streptomyces sp. NBC_01264]MCX4775438.1 ETX/MTX2 family pore-forming toxin [Streptomyces sp. NBC_01264]
MTLSVNNSDITVTNPTVKQVGETVATLGDTLFFGTATLTNNGDMEQTLRSQSFAKTITNSLSTSVTRGIETGVKVTAGFNFLVKGEAEFHQAITYSDTTMQTSTEAEIYTLPAQNIKVPAHTQATVTARLQRVTSSGNLTLRAELGGVSRVRIMIGFLPLTFDDSLYNVLGPDIYWANHPAAGGGNPPLKKVGAPPLPESITLDSVNKKVHFDETATFTATHGTQVDVAVNFTPIGQSKMKASAPASYRYSGTPQISPAQS